MQIKTSTARWRPTWSCRPTAVASGYHRDCLSHHVSSTSRGFRTTIRFAISSSARGLTTGIRSTCDPLATALISPPTSPTANGVLSVRYSRHFLFKQANIFKLISPKITPQFILERLNIMSNIVKNVLSILDDLT